jgi:predicted kinase
MQKLIIVCGLPGTGKTTLAKQLSQELNIVCLHKDSIKENLYEILGLSTLEDSRRIGKQSIQLLYELTEEQLENKLDLIIEAPFYFEGDYKLFATWQEKYNLSIYSIICQINEKERVKRFRNRERHKGHHDIERTNENPRSDEVYKKLPGKIIEINTSTPPYELVKKIKLLLK